MSPKLTIKVFTWTGALLVIGAVLAAEILSYHQELTMRASRQWVIHTHEVLEGVEHCASTLKDADISQRTYVVTGDPGYLKAYDKAANELPSTINYIQNLTKDNMAQQVNVGELKQLTAEKLTQLEQTKEARRTKGFEAAREVMIINLGHGTSNSIRAKIAEMKATEQNLLSVRTKDLNHQSQFGLLLLLLTTCVAVVSLSATSWWMIAFLTEKEKMQALARSKEREANIARTWVSTILINAPDGIITVADNSKIDFINKAADKMFGMSPGESIGKSVDVILPNVTLPTKSSSNGESKLRVETVGKRIDGTEFPVEVIFSRLDLDIGEKQATIGIIRDISERKEVERRVSEFYSIVSHELRTPLTSIRGSLSLMDGGRAGELPERASHLTKLARSEAERLIRLINDILDIRKVEAGKLELALADIEPTALVNTALQHMQELADQAHVTLVSEINATQKIHGDRDRISQVLTNLIANAIKFSNDNEKVTIRIDKIPTVDKLRFSVIDTGAGIAKEQQHKLFGLFQQLDSSDSRAKGGTGLGLAICKAIVEQHGGTIGVKSELEKGSIFWFEIPTVQDVRAAVSPTKDIPFSHTLLLVEDDSTLCEILTSTLADEGFRVVAAQTVAKAEEYIAAKLSPEVIVLDVQLPDGSGLDLMDKLAYNLDTTHIPVVIISGKEANLGKHSHPLLIDWIKKPFEERYLLGALNRALRDRHSGPARVLIAEDDETTRDLIKQELAPLNVQFIEAADGATAIQLARTMDPDLIVLDIAMPPPDGFSVVQILREERAQKTPLIVYTARDLTEQEREKLTLGLTAHLIKSRTSEEQFLDTVKDLLDGLVKTPTQMGHPKT